MHHLSFRSCFHTLLYLTCIFPYMLLLDMQNLRGINSTARVYGQNSGGYDDIEDQLESPSSLSGQRSSTAGSLALSSSAIGGNIRQACNHQTCT